MMYRRFRHHQGRRANPRRVAVLCNSNIKALDCGSDVLTATVKLAGLPLVMLRVAGENTQEACVGRLPQLKVSFPE
jgi:hypothetical protein